MNESEIIRQCQAGDWSNYGLLYEQYLPKIYGFVYNRVRHKQTTEDLVSLVFMRTVEHIGMFQEAKGGFSAWIYRIARNAIIDHYRKSKPTLDIEEASDVIFTKDFIDEVDLHMTIEQIKEHLIHLTPQQREIVLLRVWEDLSHKEIASVLNITEANSKVIFSRAVAKLRHYVPVGVLISLITQNL